ncbi:MAG: phosphoribosylformylglycinamidine synthase II, partial [Methanomicrobiaceae archaeon]|nr:phosphoribosylformylglycinamidine synthase II [Methanomicrobiaceae archaeon]
GGLLAALATLAPRSAVRLPGDDPLEALFSETCGRFLVAFREESALSGINHRVIGSVGGDALSIRWDGGELALTPGEIETALSCLLRTMRY